MRHPVLLTLAATAALGAAALGARRVLDDTAVRDAEADLLSERAAGAFSDADLRGLPEPARRYLRHAIAPGTPLASVCQLEMTGTMTPSPGRPPTDLGAVEVLAPRRGFVWTASARMNGLPVRVRDVYYEAGGGVDVTALGLVPIPFGGSTADVARSARGRLVAEGMWCPTALVHPSVQWEAAGPDRARYTLAVDGVPVAVSLHVAPDGALREVTMERWGDVDGGPWRPLPYGFAVEAEGTFGGVTIPTALRGGWFYGTDRFDPASGATFSVTGLTF